MNDDSLVIVPTIGKMGFVRSARLIAGRSFRGALREPEVTILALIVPAFLYIMMVSALEGIAEAAGIPDYRAFQLPVAVLFAVTGVSRAGALVNDIQGGYFDRLLLSPANRLAILVGLLVVDFVLVCSLAFPCVALTLLFGVQFATGVLGIIVFLVLAGVWALAFNGFAYAIALITGSPGAVSGAYLLFFPFTFLSTSLAPRDQLSGWLAEVARINPVTYLLSGFRSLIVGWDGIALIRACLSITGVGVVAVGLALAALMKRCR